jgi:hypothetical protein
VRAEEYEYKKGEECREAPDTQMTVNGAASMRARVELHSIYPAAEVFQFYMQFSKAPVRLDRAGLVP